MIQNLNYSIFLIDKLRSNWFNLLEKLNLDFNLGNQIFTALINSYSDQKRIYHSLNHVDSVLQSLKQVEHNAENTNILKFSAWFHDYVYDPKAADNEDKSAISAAKILKQLDVDNHIVEAVIQIILSTKNHKPLFRSIDNSIFLDADLAILGTEFNQYKKYAQAIRQEYSHLSDRDYQQGRKKILIKFLDRDKIYYTDHFYQRLEVKARDNIKREIKKLDSNSFV